MDLHARLRASQPQIEAAILAKAHAVSDPGEVADPEYVLGLRAAVHAATDYSIAATGVKHADPAPVPEHLLAQARAAARNGVSLDTVLRRYSAGYTVLADFLLRAGRQGEELDIAELERALHALSAVFDRLVATISVEHNSEAKRRPAGAAERRAELVRKLLAGEPADRAELPYVLDGWHLAVHARGPGGAKAFRSLAAVLDRALLHVRVEGEEIWAWLGGRSRLSAGKALCLASESLPAELTVALGEPGEGIEGWRFSHSQARAAMTVARRGRQRCVRYADVALLASALRDSVLAGTLEEIYLAPLGEERDGGMALRETLRAYLESGGHVSSTAAALKVTRQTVSRRLRALEQRIDRPLTSCMADADIALRLSELE